MMKVRLLLTSWFKRYGDGKDFLEMEVPEGSSVEDILRKSGIPFDEIGFVHSGGKLKHMSETVVDSEDLKVFTRIIGG